MIYLERTITISNNNATLNEQVVLYKGDKNVEIKFLIRNNPFKYKNNNNPTYAQLIIKRPSANPIFSEIVEMVNGRVLFIVTGHMIDELKECGDYDFQIRMFNDDHSSRATMVPITAGITIKEPLCEGDVINAGYVDSARVVDGDNVDLFDDEGNYNKTTWAGGDLITAQRMNKIEDALYEVNINSGAAFAHEHDNKDILDSITEERIQSWENKSSFDGDYNNLINKPTIPSKVSELENDSNYATESELTEAINNIELTPGPQGPEGPQGPAGTFDVDAIFSNLETTDKTIIGAINELFRRIISAHDVLPTYTQPTLSLSVEPNILIHNKTNNVMFTPSFTANDAGAVIDYKVLQSNSTSCIHEGEVIQCERGVYAKHGEEITFTAVVKYENGPVKNTANGVPYPDTSIKAGEVTANVTIPCYAYSYYGFISEYDTFDANDIMNLKEVLHTSKEATLYYDFISAGNVPLKTVYMYPSSFGKLTSIKDYNGFEYLDVSIAHSTIEFNGVQYNAYVMIDAVNTELSAWKFIYS